MKKRAFDADEISTEAEAPERTEPTPRGRTAIALVLGSWVLPLALLRALFTYSEDDPTTRIVHRVISLGALAFLLTAIALAVRAIDVARKSPRVRRRLAIAALVLGGLTPIVWAAEMALAFRIYLVRQALDASEEEEDAPDTPPSSPPDAG